MPSGTSKASGLTSPSLSSQSVLSATNPLGWSFPIRPNPGSPNPSPSESRYQVWTTLGGSLLGGSVGGSVVGGSQPRKSMHLPALPAALVDYLTRDHERLPDVEACVRLPENVHVVQYATATNGHTALREKLKIDAVLAEIATERLKHPVIAEQEGAVCFRAMKRSLTESGFQEDRVVTFGSVRGTNSLADVERLHLVGRPMPPGDDLVFLAQVLHPGDLVISGRMVLSARRYGGQPYEVDVVDFEDPRVAALLRSQREDEMEQAIHRARIFALRNPQLGLFRGGGPEERRQVRVVLHTSHPVPGLRVDELILTNLAEGLNQTRHRDADRRIQAAVLQIQEACEYVTAAKVATMAKASRRTAAEYLRNRDHTPKEDLSYKGVMSPPQAMKPGAFPARVLPVKSTEPSPGLCRGGCRKPMPPGQMCFECAAREATAWAHSRRGEDPDESESPANDHRR